MSRAKRIAINTAIACAVFIAALQLRTSQLRERAPGQAPIASDAPDDEQLLSLGIKPGRQLVAYVFGGSRCGFCQKSETKTAFASVRQVLNREHVSSRRYSAVSVVGVAVNTDLMEGLEYLESIGSNAFTEISIGSGWQNEHIIRLIRREHVAALAVPLVIVLERSMSATLAPLTLTYGVDSVIKVVQGAGAIVDWVNNGAALAEVKSARNGQNSPLERQVARRRGEELNQQSTGGKRSSH